MICNSLDVYLFSFFFNFADVSNLYLRHNTIQSQRAAFETVSTEIVNYSQICFRTLFKGAQKIHREGSFKESVFFGIVIKMDHYLSLKILHTNAKKKRRDVYLIQNIKVGHFSTYVSVVAFCDFRQRLWPLSGLDRRPYQQQSLSFLLEVVVMLTQSLKMGFA